MFLRVGYVVLVCEAFIVNWVHLAGSVSSNIKPFCSQLGCEEKGRFRQVGQKLSVSKTEKFVVWHSANISDVPLDVTNQNYGCVGNEVVVACPYHDKLHGQMRHIMLNPQTSEEYITSKYRTLGNVGSPVVTKEGLVFAFDGSRSSLIDVSQELSTIYTLPQGDLFKHGFFSPIYLMKMGLIIILAKQNNNMVMFKVGKSESSSKPEITLLTITKLTTNGTDCPWFTMTEPVANDNRIYAFGSRGSGSPNGFLAFDVTEETPYWKLAWYLVDPPSSECPKAGDITPPDTFDFQLLATADNYLLMSSPAAIIVLKDYQTHSNITSSLTLFGGAHFLSLDSALKPLIWTAPFRRQQIYNGSVIGLDYTQGYNGFAIMDIAQHLNVSNFDITSRITTFPHSGYENKSVLVFGARMSADDATSLFITKYCPDAKPKMVVSVVMAVVMATEQTSQPEVLWMSLIPHLGYDLDVKGQIINVADDLLVAYASDGTHGYVMGIK